MDVEIESSRNITVGTTRRNHDTQALQTLKLRPPPSATSAPGRPAGPRPLRTTTILRNVLGAECVPEEVGRPERVRAVVERNGGGLLRLGRTCERRVANRVSAWQVRRGRPKQAQVSDSRTSTFLYAPFSSTGVNPSWRYILIRSLQRNQCGVSLPSSPVRPHRPPALTPPSSSPRHRPRPPPRRRARFEAARARSGRARGRARAPSWP